MLCLVREANQVVYIENPETGDILTLVVLSIKGKRVRLGFEDSNKSFTILRKELKENMAGKVDPSPYYDVGK